MAKSKTDKAKLKGNLWYNIFYIVSFSVIVVIGLFSNSFFAYEFFNSLFFNVLYLVLTVALFVVRSIQTFLRQTALYGKIFTLTYFNMFAIVFAVRPFVSARLWSILLFAGFAVAITLLVILAFKYTKDPSGYVITRFEPIIAMIPLLLLLMLAMIQSYTDAGKMWIPIVAAGAALSIIALVVFLKFFKNIDYFRAKHKSEFICAIILLVVACFYISGTAVTTINYAFDHSPTATSFEIIDKHIESGSRQGASFYFKIEVDSKEKEIRVPVEVYHSKETGDRVDIWLYSGALGYSYYIFEYAGEG